ncbi:MAG: hypothetical protein K0U84_08645 [Actinomycetia bacterium]|nr:hypothetical protein [Actinomycetes bacterium]
MADASHVPPEIARTPDRNRRSLNMAEAARRAGKDRRTLIRQLVELDPTSGWVDTSGQKIMWYFYEDALPGREGDRVAELAADVEQLRSEIGHLRSSQDAAEVADLRARLVAVEETNALLMEAFELQEAAGQRFRQALALHTTPGHAGELASGPARVDR